jgi:hypothetical protein
MFTIMELREEIIGGLARGYCSKSNETKVLDPDLIEAMADEVTTAVDNFLANQ